MLAKSFCHVLKEQIPVTNSSFTEINVNKEWVLIKHISGTKIFTTGARLEILSDRRWKLEATKVVC